MMESNATIIAHSGRQCWFLPTTARQAVTSGALIGILQLGVKP